MHLRELSRLRRGLALSLLLAIVATILSIYRVSLSPLALHPRELEIAAASTAVVIDTPKSQLSNLAAPSITPLLTIRATLLGNVMSSQPVLNYIGQFMGVPPNRIAGRTRSTANVPRVLIEPGSGANATDILSSPDHYRLEVQADPAVPVLRIYTQAPTKAAALRLADASVTALRAYLGKLAASQRIPGTDRIELIQLGRATGGVANPGINVQIGALAFITVFGIASCALLFLSRTRRGWHLAKRAEPAQT